jgi:anti-anti-sigma factor
MERMMSLIQITQRNEKVPVTVFQIRDRISLDNFAELEALTADAYAKGMRCLVLDLSQLQAITSIGVRAIVVIHKILSAEGGNPLKLAAAQPPIRDVLQIAGITQFIDVYDTVEEAAASF